MTSLRLIAAAAAALLSTSAFAQSPPAPYVQGNAGLTGFFDGPGIRLRTERVRGIRAGDFLLWPGLVLEGRYDSNFFQGADSEAPKPVPVLRIVPSFGVSNPNPNRIALSLGANADIRLLLSSDEAVQKQQGVGATTDLRVDILPKAPVSVTIQDSFRRALETPNFSTSTTYDQNVNKAAIQVRVQPGGGALRVITGYAFGFDFFDDYAAGDYMYHEARLLATWRFYPKTAAFLEGSGQFWSWQNPDVNDPLVRHIDNNPLRVVAGVNGYVTKKIAALIKLGYGNSFHDAGPAFNSAIGQVELGYKFIPSVLLAGGFSRDFQNSYYANFYTENRTYLRVQADLWHRLKLDASAAYHLIDFAEFDPGDSTCNPNTTVCVHVSHTERRDQAVTGHLSAEVDITRWIGLTVGYEVRGQFTNFETTVRGPLSPPEGSVDKGEYIKHQVYASLNVRY